MNKYLFKRVIFFRLTGSIRQIQEDLFEHFIYLNLLFVETDDIGQFFKNGINWVRSLNKGMRVDFQNGFSIEKSLLVKLVKFSEIASPFRNVYSYPDTDKNFPHNQLVMPMILSTRKFVCTCTIIWLIRYSNFKLYNRYFELNITLKTAFTDRLNLSYIYCLDRNITCDFKDLLKNCNVTNVNVRDLRGVYRDFFLFKWIQMIMEVFVRPTFSILGLITNLLNIIIIRNEKSKKELKNLMYKNILQ